MPGKPVQIGPFTAGLNNISLAGEARDTEVVDLINMEVSLDTSLVSRPPIEVQEDSVISTVVDSNWEVLGIYRVSSDEWYLIVRRPSGVTDTTVFAYANGIITTTPDYTIKVSTGLNNMVLNMIQFQDLCFFNVGPTATDRGFSWSKTSAATTISAMPRGYVMVSWKSRLWVSGTDAAATGDRVYFSDIDSGGLKPGEWNANDFFDVAPGEGGFITALMPSFNNLIVFKSDGTWRFSYPTSPSQGTIDKISGQIGCATANSVVEFENFIYVYDQGRVYELINGNYTQLNLNVRFTEDEQAVDSVSSGIDLSIVNRRLIVRYYNSLYVFTVDTKSWSQWRSFAGTPGKFWELPGDSAAATSPTYVAGSRGVSQRGTLSYIDDDYDADYLRTGAISNPVSPTHSLTVNGTAITITCNAAAGTWNMMLNNALGDAQYNIPVGPGQQFEAQWDLTTTDDTTHLFKVEYLLLDGTTSFATHTMTVGTAQTHTFTVPATAILAKVYIGATTQNLFSVTTYDNLSFKRLTTTAPKTVLQIVDNYTDVVNSKEYIECYVRTKSYDYKAPSVFKKMFWWGLDVLTKRRIQMEARPIGRMQTFTWGDLLNYTSTELEAGTWGNPLSFLNSSLSVVDETTPGTEISENGRFFVKAMKALRFRQISFIVQMTTLGDNATGPVKLFSIISYVHPKEKVVDKSS